MHRRYIDMLDEVLIARCATLHTDTATVLCAILGQRGTLDITHMRNGDNHIIISIEILGIELLSREDDLRTALVAILLLHLLQLVLDDLHLHTLVSQHCIVVVDTLLQLIALSSQLAVLQTGQSTQAHLHNCRSLQLRQTELLHQRLTTRLGILRCADRVDHFVDIVLSDQQTLHNVQTLRRLLQIELSAAYHNLMAVVDELSNQILQVEQHRATINQRDVVHRKRGLQLSILIERIEHHARHSVLLQDDHNANTVAVALVIDVCDTLQLLLVDHIGDLLDHLGLIDHIGDLGDHDALTTRRRMLDLGLGTHNHATTTRFECLTNALVTVDDTTRREVGTLDIFSQLRNLDLLVVNVCTASVANLTQVMGSHIGCHTYRNTARTIDQQQRNLGGQHRRFGSRIIEVERKVDRILLDVGHNLISDLAHTSLSITHRSCRVAIHRAKVTLTVNQRVTHRPLLRHTYHCVVNRRVAVRVELTEHITHDTSRLTVRLIRVEVQFVAHIVKNTTMNGFEAVAYIGQGTRNDYRHRIVDVGRFHFLLDVDRNDLTTFLLFQFF